MIRYLSSRLFVFIIAFFLLTVFTFSLNFFFPGDPVTNMTGVRTFSDYYPVISEIRGADKNIAFQYINYMQNLLSGNWGASLSSGDYVFEHTYQHLFASLELIVGALILAVLIGVPSGIFAATQFRGPIDKGVISLAMAGYSIPVFWLAQLLILFFAVKLDWLPITGQINPLYGIAPQSGSILIDIVISDSDYKAAALQDALNHLILPVIILSIMPMMLLLRLMRNATQEMLQKPYVKAARARGLNEFQVLIKHAVPNATQSVLQQVPLIFSLLLSNSIVIESIFNWPGIGNWLVRAIFERDFPVIQACVLIIALTILLFNLVVDLYRGWRFPIVRQE
ncbi:ABC transporter permease [uncultured Idiomarina sp.]|uniref:ABC transporter permease n=1 Tax=uncultured Idiomarina sp. TaxID=352961 RepID=UPI002598C69D|nr:ABC transporter permease [uncultured Idiomarina sp.]